MESSLPNEYPKITARSFSSENPNDNLSTKAIDLKFYDENKHNIGEGSISSIDTPTGFMYNIEVFKPYRGKGYGNAIVNYILTHYKVTDVTVEVGNDIAYSLYEKFGFKKVKNFKENGKDMIFMQRKKRDV